MSEEEQMMPKLIKFYIVNCLIGFAISAAFTAALLWFNVANLWHLIAGSDIGLMAVVVFWMLNGIVFAGVQFGVAVMLLADSEDDGPRGGTGVPVRIPAQAMAGRSPPTGHR
jgi:hypothetical protein